MTTLRCVCGELVDGSSDELLSAVEQHLRNVHAVTAEDTRVPPHLVPAHPRTGSDDERPLKEEAQ